jgi:hypothetical protein
VRAAAERPPPTQVLCCNAAELRGSTRACLRCEHIHGSPLQLAPILLCTLLEQPEKLQHHHALDLSARGLGAGDVAANVKIVVERHEHVQAGAVVHHVREDGNLLLPVLQRVSCLWAFSMACASFRCSFLAGCFTEPCAKRWFLRLPPASKPARHAILAAALAA